MHLKLTFVILSALWLSCTLTTPQSVISLTNDEANTIFSCAEEYANDSPAYSFFLYNHLAVFIKRNHIQLFRIASSRNASQNLTTDQLTSIIEQLKQRAYNSAEKDMIELQFLMASTIQHYTNDDYYYMVIGEIFRKNQLWRDPNKFSAMALLFPSKDSCRQFYMTKLTIEYAYSKNLPKAIQLANHISDDSDLIQAYTAISWRANADNSFLISDEFLAKAIEVFQKTVFPLTKSSRVLN